MADVPAPAYPTGASVNPLTNASNTVGLVNSLQQTQSNQLSIQKQQLDLHQQHIQNFYDFMGSLSAKTDKEGKPNVTGSDIQEAATKMTDLGLATPQEAATLLKDVKPDWTTKEAMPWVKLHQARAIGALNTIGAMQNQYMQDLGGGVQPLNLNKLTGQISPNGHAMKYSVPPTQPKYNPLTGATETVGSTFDGAGNNTKPGVTNASSTPPASGGVQITPPLGTEKEVEGSVNAYNTLNDNDSGFANRSFQLKQAIGALQTAKTGKGTEGLNSLKSVLLSLTPEKLKAIGVTPDEIEVADYDKAKKYLTQYASSFPGAGRSDAGLMTALTGNASTQINNMAAQDVAKYALGMERLQHDQLLEFNKEGKPPANYNKWKTNYQTNADPTAFAADQFTPEQLKRILSKHSAADAKRFDENYRRAVANGLVEHKVK